MAHSIPYTELGVGGIFALILIDKVFTFVRNRNGSSTTQTMKLQMQGIHDFTIRQDEVTKQLVKVQEAIADNSIKQTNLLEKINDKQGDISKTLTRIASNGRQ